MFTNYEAGTVLRAQLNPESSELNFMVGNQNWKSIESEKLYPTKVRFGNKPPWTGDALGFWMGEIPFLVLDLSFEDDSADRFIEEFMRMTFVEIEYQGKNIASLKLTGTYAAMTETLECQMQMFESGSSYDPFSSGGAKSDPFE